MTNILIDNIDILEDVIQSVDNTGNLTLELLLDNGFSCINKKTDTSERRIYSRKIDENVVYLSLRRSSNSGFIIQKEFFIMEDEKLLKHRENDLPQKIEYDIFGNVRKTEWALKGKSERIHKGLEYPVRIEKSDTMYSRFFNEFFYLNISDNEHKLLLYSDKIVLYSISYLFDAPDVIDDVHYVYKLKGYKLTQLNKFREMINEPPITDIESVTDLFTKSHLDLLEMYNF